MKLFIFDLGGVVIPASESEIITHISDRTGKSASDIKSAYDQLILKAHTCEITIKELYNHMSAALGFGKDKVQLLYDFHIQVIKKNIRDWDEVLVNMIQQFKEDRTVVCMTNTEPETSDELEASGLYNLFHKSYPSTKLKLMKPDEAVFRHILNDQQVKAKETIFIDDRLENVVAASKLGIHGVLYQHVSPLVKEIYQLLKGES